MKIIIERTYHFSEYELKELVISIIEVTTNCDAQAEYADILNSIMTSLRSGSHNLAELYKNE
jgi:hypothetical protein